MPKRNKVYMIWSCHPLDVSRAVMHGLTHGTSFKDACSEFFGTNPQYDNLTNRFWGCKLYPSQEDVEQSPEDERLLSF